MPDEIGTRPAHGRRQARHASQERAQTKHHQWPHHFDGRLVQMPARVGPTFARENQIVQP